MPLSEKELQLIPQFEKLSVNLERLGLHSWKSRLSQAEKKKIFQVARLINEQQTQVTPRAKFRKNLEKSIGNHMKRMATHTGKNIRIIRPPPEGLRVLKNGEWIIPKRQSDFKTSEERTKQLLSQVPITIPDIEKKIHKNLQTRKACLNKKSRLALVTRQSSFIDQPTEDEQIEKFKRVLKKFLKKRIEFMRSMRNLQNELEDIRFEYSATRLISRSISRMIDVDEKENGGGKRRRRRWRKRSSEGRALRGIGSCPEFDGRKKS